MDGTRRVVANRTVCLYLLHRELNQSRIFLNLIIAQSKSVLHVTLADEAGSGCSIKRYSCECRCGDSGGESDQRFCVFHGIPLI